MVIKLRLINRDGHDIQAHERIFWSITFNERESSVVRRMEWSNQLVTGCNYNVEKSGEQKSLEVYLMEKLTIKIQLTIIEFFAKS